MVKSYWNKIKVGLISAGLLLSAGRGLAQKNDITLGLKQIGAPDNLSQNAIISIKYGHAFNDKWGVRIGGGVNINGLRSPQSVLEAQILRSYSIENSSIFIEPNIQISQMFGSLATRLVNPTPTSPLTCYRPFGIGIQPGLQVSYRLKHFYVPLSLNYGWYNIYGKHINEDRCRSDISTAGEIRNIASGRLSSMEIGFGYCW